MTSARIRPEAAGDRAAIHRVNTLAFERSEEAELVDALRNAGALALSCVAEVNGTIAGYVAFSPVTIAGAPVRALGLGPMAVLPELQRGGIGTALGGAALDHARRAGWQAVVVLGHPEYYPRFGFEPASSFGLRCEYDAPDEAFMALALEPDGLAGVRGLVRYHEAFGSV